MFTDRIESRWVQAFAHMFELCKMRKTENIVILRESQSRQLNVHITELALGQLGLSYFTIAVPTQQDLQGPIIRSSGATAALNGQDKAVFALQACDVVIDLTIEGLMHAPQTSSILKSGARIFNISNEHPEALCRLIPNPDLKDQAKEAVQRCKSAKFMSVQSNKGTNLNIDMVGAATVGVWGWTDKPGTLAHWPGGIIVSFPKAGSVMTVMLN